MSSNDKERSPHASGSTGTREFPRVVIVGAGISGLCLAMQLKRAGITSFTLLEQSDEVGGTWLDNSYPGCGCDVPSIVYSFSFAPKSDWSRKYAPQSEILDYFRDCADRFKIRSHIRFGTSVSSASFDEQASVWQIETKEGESIEADLFVSAVGQLSRPKIPDFDGLESLEGRAFHSARWDHDFDPTGRDVAVIGNGASAIQLVPKLAEKARRLTLFQRSPNWISQRHDYRYPWIVQQMFRWVPGVAKLHRLWLFLSYEWRILLYQRRGKLNQGFTQWLRYWMRRKIPKRLQEDVIPRYPAGCKRVLLSNDFLETLHRDNVHLETAEIRRFVPEGVQTDAGVTPVDAAIFCTGFESNQFLYPMEITGRGGVRLQDQWDERPRTYLGMMCPNFPNLFMLYGPNTNLGHNSIIFMVECQVRFLLKCLRTMKRQGDQTIEVREEAVAEFDEQLQVELRKKVWSGYVTNWYKTADGHIVNNWHGSTLSYWRRTRNPDFEQFDCQPRPPGTPVKKPASTG